MVCQTQYYLHLMRGLDTPVMRGLDTRCPVDSVSDAIFLPSREMFLNEKRAPPPAEDARIWGFRNSSGILSPSRSSLRIPGFGDSGIWGLSPNPALPRLRGLGAGIRGLGHCPRVPKSWPRRNCSGRAGIWGLSQNPQIPASPNPGRDTGTVRIWGQSPNTGRS